MIMQDLDPSSSNEKNSETDDIDDNRFNYYIRNLSDENPGKRWKAADSLGRLGDLRAVEPLIDALSDDDRRVRVKVIWALGSIGDVRALGPLQQLYRIEADDNREIIEEALVEIKRQMIK
jgi:HEAT repeat protein